MFLIVLIIVLREQNGTGLEHLYINFTLVDPAMPISPTYAAAGCPLCKPFVNPLFGCMSLVVCL
jgi:hypothetical protein